MVRLMVGLWILSEVSRMNGVVPGRTQVSGRHRATPRLHSFRVAFPFQAFQVIRTRSSIKAGVDPEYTYVN